MELVNQNTYICRQSSRFQDRWFLMLSNQSSLLFWKGYSHQQMWICEVSWHIFHYYRETNYYNIKLKTVHYPDSLQWLPIRYQIQAGHFMGTRNSCQLQKHYYNSMKKKELYYLKEKSSYLLVHLSEVFEKRLLHFLPYFRWHCPFGISQNIVYFW